MQAIMAKSSGDKNSNLIWRFFSSVKLTLVLLIILAITSLFGTLIPQQEGAVEFARGLSPGMFQVFSALNLFDMYHSTWFRIIIGLLALNLIICSINRLPTTLKLFRAPTRADRSRPFEDLPAERNFSVKGEMDDVGECVANFLKKQYKRVEAKNSPKGHFYYGEKGRYAYFGVYLVHLSVLVILIGGIIGSLFGFEAYVNIAEGDTVDSVALRQKMTPKKLGFSVHCEKFIVEFYENGAPKEYRSDLRFLSAGKVVQQGSLLVNHPITFKGITFYQSSYGTIPGKVHLKISRTENNPETLAMEVEQGKPVSLPGDKAQFQVMQVDNNLKGMMGPAAMISVKPEQGDELKFWVFQRVEMLKKRFPGAMFRAPILNPSSFKPYTFYLEKLENRYYTGLQVARDPGVPLVWLGCFVMVGGFFVTFFTSHRRVWVRVSKSKGKTRISVAGRANKNPIGMERELEQVTSKLQNLFIGEGKNP
jgi:cytochrome c biogenesis protein